MHSSHLPQDAAKANVIATIRNPLQAHHQSRLKAPKEKARLAKDPIHLAKITKTMKQKSSLQSRMRMSLGKELRVWVPRMTASSLMHLQTHATKAPWSRVPPRQTAQSHQHAQAADLKFPVKARERTSSPNSRPTADGPIYQRMSSFTLLITGTS